MTGLLCGDRHFEHRHFSIGELLLQLPGAREGYAFHMTGGN